MIGAVHWQDDRESHMSHQVKLGCAGLALTEHTRKEPAGSTQGARTGRHHSSKISPTFIFIELYTTQHNKSAMFLIRNSTIAYTGP